MLRPEFRVGGTGESPSRRSGPCRCRFFPPGRIWRDIKKIGKMCVCVPVYLCVCVCVFECACVCAGERERDETFRKIDRHNIWSHDTQESHCCDWVHISNKLCQCKWGLWLSPVEPELARDAWWSAEAAYSSSSSPTPVDVVIKPFWNVIQGSVL